MSQTPRCRLDMAPTLARHDARFLPTTWTSSGKPTKNGVLGIPFLQTCREAMSGKSIVCSLERLVVMPFPRTTSPEKLPPPMTSRVHDGIVVVGTPGGYTQPQMDGSQMQAPPLCCRHPAQVKLTSKNPTARNAEAGRFRGSFRCMVGQAPSHPESLILSSSLLYASRILGPGGWSVGPSVK
jgi:hypothetical protein